MTPCLPWSSWKFHDRERSLKGTRLIPRLNLEDEGSEECALALLTGM